MRPQRAIAASTIAATAASSVTEAAAAIASPPATRISAATRSAGSAARSLTNSGSEAPGALRQGVVDMALDLLDRGPVDHRPDIDAGIGTRADLHRRDAGRELVGEAVIDAVLHQDAVGADAGLTAIAELGDEHAFDRKVEIGVIEDDEGRVAAELQAKPLDAV